MICPICNRMNTCQELPTDGRDSRGFDCKFCGKYEISKTYLATSRFRVETQSENNLTDRQKALLSYRLRKSSDDSKPVMIDPEWLDPILSSDDLPNPAARANNLIRFIGDTMTKRVHPIKNFPEGISSIIGAPNDVSVYGLASELMAKGIIKAKVINAPVETLIGIDLTLDGWNQYEFQKRGQISEGYAFIAMEFGDPILDPFVEGVIKPIVKDIGYELVHMRDVPRAGIIDNIMMEQIRNSSFVIADLTHDNPGAYWEAGYAEGLGKPVIYICEKDKFTDLSSHFDTNHRTTVFWSKDDNSHFKKELAATISRSMHEQSN